MERTKVLVADDEKVIRELFVRFLSGYNYEVFTAVDGFDALNKLKRDNFDVLITDIKMPEMDGMELIHKIKKIKKDIIIIVITGYGTIETAKEAIKQGCFDYITKPFNIEDINIVIKRAFDVQRLFEQKKKLQEQIQVTERLASLAQMGAGVAHEVNTVLTSIKLFLEMLKPKLRNMKKEVRNIGLILEEIKRAEGLINRFLNFTRPIKPEFIKVDINKIIKRSLEFLNYKFAQQKINILYELNERIPMIICDPHQMEEVFLNIFSNSIDAMPQGGNLTIRTEITENKMVITVSDTGRGISSENLQKLYNPFFTTKLGNVGLGLSIVHRIIEEHRGIITIESKKNIGTTVKIELPIQTTKVRKTKN